MNTPTINITAGTAAPHEERLHVQRGWVLYDGRCRMCRSGARRFGAVLKRRGFDLQPLQRAWVVHRLGLPRDELLREMRVVMSDGQILGGADALVHLAGFIWWGWPLSAWARWPRGALALRWMYRAAAQRRGCSNAVCATTPAYGHVRRWLPGLMVVSMSIAAGPALPRWAWMWILAVSLFAACKWLAWQSVGEAIGRRAGLVRNLGFLFAWLGMDAASFLNRRVRSARPRIMEWASASLKLLLGIALIWGVIPQLPIDRELLVGWVGMIGLIFVLHFGAFHLLSQIWRWRGVDAPHLFRWPIAASSLGDFWGNRWNGGFRQLAHDFVFQPMHRRAGIAMATLVTFLVSGLVHELVISAPAGAGFGLPTMYFAIQGCGLLAERSRFGRRLGLRRGLIGRMFAIVIVAAPAFWLFHPPFVHNVILPFLRAIGAM